MEGNSPYKLEQTFMKYGQTNTFKYNTEDSVDFHRTQQSPSYQFNDKFHNFMKKELKKRSYNIPRMLESKNLVNEPHCAVINNVCDCYTDTKVNRTQINCRHENLTRIPEFVYNGVLYLNISFSAGNRISYIQDNAFTNLKVEKIDLLNNQLTNIENGAFNGLESYLQELLLEGGGIRSQKVPFTSMIQLYRLHKLTLKNFNLGILNKTNYFRFFNNLEEMSFLDLSLKGITEDAFIDRLPKLHSFYFDNVELKYIPVDGLSQLKSLQKLKIRRTKITRIFSQSFKQMTKLKELILPLNEIQMMEKDAFIGVSNQLTILDLSSNQLTSESLLALSTKEWNNLTHLSLSYNRNLRTIPEQMCMFMPNLQYLNMVQIDLRHISKSMLTGLKKLFVLDLSWNNIQTIEDFAFLNLNNLNELMLKHQFKEPTASPSKKLELMENRFQGLEQSLESLTLEGTKTSATQFWSTISILKELKQLNIAETGLRHIPNYAFIKNTKLRELDMDNNGITYLNQAAFRGLEHSLQDLELNFNNLTTISHCVFEYFTSLQLIHLTENPLNCDYRIEWLHTLIHKNSHSPLFLESEFTCKTPNKYADVSLYNIPARELTCHTDACIPETCNPTTAATTTTTLSSKTTSRITKQSTTTRRLNKLELTVVSKKTHSLSIAWKVTYDTDTTGFILEYRPTTLPKETSKVIHIHRSDYTHTLHNLYPGTYYYICVTAEIQQQVDDSMEDCTTEQTIAIDNGSGKLDPEISSSSPKNSNVTTGIIIATVGVVVLIIVGVCAIVKYKIQKIKEVGRTLERMHSPYDRQYYDANKMGKCVTPNEYSDIDDAMIARKYQSQSPRNVKRQFGIDNQAFDHAEMNPYHYGSYHKLGVKRQRRKNPYENDDEEDNEQVSIDTDSTVHYKSDLELRHSAPSRLDADDLKKQYIRNSRPLPATPIEANRQKRSSTLKPIKKDKSDRKRETVVTLATIHDNVS